MSTSVRSAEPADAAAVTELLRELGYHVTLDSVRRTLTTRTDGNEVFVASTNGAVVGMISLVVSRWIQLEKPIARIPAMIVTGKSQRRGIGRLLVEHALDHARRAGCGTVELTSAHERSGAHAFYRDLGFEETSVRFKKVLRCTEP